MTRKTYHEPKKVKIHSVTEKLFVVFLIIGCLILLAISSYFIIRSVGKSSLLKHGKEYSGNLQEIETVPIEDESVRELQDGEIYYDGDIYAYNEDLMTFMVLGIDSYKDMSQEKTPGTAGQADSIFLVVANPHTKKLNVVAVNRDTMTEIETYDTSGGYAGKEKAQITLQYAYGDGQKQSCELMEKAVSNVLYGIPIHGYVSLDMKAIPVINDAVGGVTLTVLEDMDFSGRNWKTGDEITLHGEDALWYLRARDEFSKELGSNLNRIARQKQYLSLFSQKLKEKSMGNMMFPIQVYEKIKKHVFTSLSIDEMTYLITTYLPYEFNANQIYSYDGELKMGEVSEEFYANQDDVKKLVVELFYEKTD